MLYLCIQAGDWDLSCVAITVHVQSFWSHHYVIAFDILMAFHMLKYEFYGVQLDDLLLNIGVYCIIISDGISWVQGGSMVVDAFNNTLVVAVYVYCHLC